MLSDWNDPNQTEIDPCEKREILENCEKIEIVVKRKIQENSQIEI